METSDTLALPTVSALRHLEPRPGGQWAITGQSSNSYSLAYIMDGGADVICYTMQPCITEEDVRTHCGSLIYNYSGAKVTGCGGLSATQNTASGGMHVVLRPKQDNGSSVKGLALDPLMIGTIPESQVSNDSGQQSQFEGLVQSQTQSNIFGLNSGSSNGQSQQQMMSAISGSMNWPSSETILPGMAMTTMAQLPNDLVSGNENSGLLSDLWDENFGRIEPTGDDTSGQTGWSLQFGAS